MVGNIARIWSNIFVSLLGIEHRQTDWKTFLVNKLVGAKTLPESFRQKVGEDCFRMVIELDIILDSILTSLSI